MGNVLGSRNRGHLPWNGGAWGAVVLITLGMGVLGMGSGAIAAESPEAEPPEVSSEAATDPYIRPNVSCPSDFDTLTTLLLRDLPSYANRVSQRASSLLESGLSESDVLGSEIPADRPVYPTENRLQSYVLLAERPDTAPLTLGPGQYNPADPSSEPPQLFFTTLERQYSDRGITLRQHHHWLFLTPTENGWHFVLMFSRLADYPDGTLVTPPRDTSYGVVAEAARQWLADCRSENIFP